MLLEKNKEKELEAPFLCFLCYGASLAFHYSAVVARGEGVE